MKSRFKEICSVLGLSQQELADKLSMDVRKLRSRVYESKNFPSEFLAELSTKLNVNINWLLTGEGGMFNTEDKNTLEMQNDVSIQNRYMNLGSRLFEMQQKNNLSDRETAKILGIYEDEYIDLKNGGREINIKIINSIKQHFKVSIDWLLYGN